MFVFGLFIFMYKAYAYLCCEKSVAKFHKS